METTSAAVGGHSLNDILHFLDQVEKSDDLSTLQRDTDIKCLNSDWDIDKDEPRLDCFFF